MKKNHAPITDLLALLVFGLFTVCLLLVLLTGARVYRDLVDRSGESYASRTAAMYVTTRVRQAQALTVENFGGSSCLTLREDIDGETYLTRVYCYDGCLRELFCAESAALSPEDGEKILEAESLTFSLDGALLTVRLEDAMLQLRLPPGKEAAP